MMALSLVEGTQAQRGEDEKGAKEKPRKTGGHALRAKGSTARARRSSLHPATCDFEKLIFDGLIGRQAGETDTLAGIFHAFLIGNGGGHGGRPGWLGR